MPSELQRIDLSRLYGKMRRDIEPIIRRYAEDVLKDLWILMERSYRHKSSLDLDAFKQKVVRANIEDNIVWRVRRILQWKSFDRGPLEVRRITEDCWHEFHEECEAEGCECPCHTEE